MSRLRSTRTELRFCLSDAARNGFAAKGAQARGKCLYRGIEVVKPGAPVWAIGRAIQQHAEAHGFGVVRTFCGHAIGHEFHGALSIPHYEERAASLPLEEGMTFTIEPMITMGTYRERIWSDGWTAVTADGLRTAQFEHTIAVTDDGAEILTPSASLAL